jgi:hypothetical protein
VTSELLADRVDSVAHQLGQFGFTTVALHGDLFDGPDRERMERALARMDPESIVSINGGERLVAFAVPRTSGDPREAWERWTQGADSEKRSPGRTRQR